VIGNQDQRDRAAEWVGVAYPHDEGEAWEAAFVAALRDIIAIDAARDEAEAATDAHEPSTGRRVRVYDGAGYDQGWVTL